MTQLKALGAALALSAASSHAQETAPTQSLSLGAAARLAAEQSAPAVIAYHRAEQSRARTLETRSALLPRVTATWSDGKRTFNSATFGLPLPGRDPNGEIIGPVRTVDFRGRVVASLVDAAAFGRYRSAQAATSSAEADAAQIAELAAATATAAYVRALRADAHVNAHAADSALASELLDIAQRQLQAGVGVALDVTRARSQLAATRAQLIAARNERDRARLDLLRGLGLPLATTVALTDSLAQSTDEALPAEDAAIAAAQRERADLRAAAAATQAARRALRAARAARAERLPTLGVFGDDGATSTSYSRLLNTYTYGVQITLPVFEGVRTSARVRQQIAALHEAEARQRDLDMQIIADVRAALLDVVASREQALAARERLLLGEQELTQARERFRAGVSGNADVITAQLGLNAARSQFVDALASSQLARVSLARAQGRVTKLP